MSTSLESPRLPVVDLSPIDAGDPWRDHVAAQLDWAAAEFGFFYVVGHGVDRALIDSVMALSRKFFAWSEAEKLKIRMSLGGRAWRGYFPVGGELTSGRPDRKEGLYFGEELGEDDPRVRVGTPLHGRNLFPALPGFSDAVLDYMRALTGVGHRLMASIGRGLRVGDHYFVDHFTRSPTTLFRIFNYPPAPPMDVNENQGVGAHTDYGLLTMLYQDEVGGLQIQYGDEWIDVPPVAGSFVVNVGDMLALLTAGRYKSALHRVVNSSPRERISMPFFFDPGFDAELAPIPGVAAYGPRADTSVRWDGIDLRDVRGTYGDYLIGKVSKVFPALRQQHLGPRRGG
jgi:isopenicillin N synthase-like dioxygenase